MEPVETKDLTVDEFREMSLSRRKRTFRKTHITDSFRTVAWYNLSNPPWRRISASKMGEAVEGKPDVTAKWLGYKWGRYVPSIPMARKVEELHPGSLRILEHVLWAAIRTDLPYTSALAEQWLQRLHPEIQLIVLKHGVMLATEKWNDPRSNSTGLKMLEARASLDALACLIIQLRAANEAHNTTGAHQLGRYICRMMLALGSALSAYGLARPLGEYIEREILPLAAHRGCHYTFWHNGYQNAITVFKFHACSITGTGINAQILATQPSRYSELLKDSYSRLIDLLVINSHGMPCRSRWV